MNEYQQYVLVWCHRSSNPGDTLLILKNRPDWTAGRLNLPGGKVEPEETPEQAARRELMEETGYECIAEPKIVGKKVGRGFLIWVLKAIIDSDAEPQPRENETEVALWIEWSRASKDRRLLPSLRVIVPLCMTGVEDFIIEGEQEGRGASRHAFSISVCDQEFGMNNF